MRLPVRLAQQHPLRKVIAAAVIAALATVLAVGMRHIPGLSVAMGGLDNTLYDAFYRFRKPEDRTGQPIVIVAVDDATMAALAKKKYSRPYPRVLWGDAIKYLEQCGAKAVVFDYIFQEPAQFDKEFGAALDAAKIPVVVGSMFQPDGKPAPFAPQVKKPPTLGAVNILTDKVIREYPPSMYGAPSLAVRGVQAVGTALPAWAKQPFRLHYYGPTQWKDGRHTYHYVSAFNVFVASSAPARAHELGADPEFFRGKIVLIGAIAAAEFDLKSSPVSELYPGVEAQATAVDNLVSSDYVRPFSGAATAGLAFIASLLAAIGVILPKRVTFKISAAVGTAAALIGAAVLWFVANDIRWLPMAAPLLALLITTIGSFAFSYVTEDRQRRMLLKALSQYLSPQVAADIAKDFASMKLGGQRREMTVMFTDIAGFTTISETMDSERLSAMLNFYLGEMSALIWSQNGTLDKYIGDAIMSFWNAPVLQPDHAAMACNAALAMRDREAAIQGELGKLGAPGMMTRMGINTGPMVFGNMGSPQKFNYTVLGDSVNLGSRLEGANKLYDSRILLAETTAVLVRDRFVLRELDLLQVKGKNKPMAVFELLSPGPGDDILLERVRLYEQALGLYRAQKWDEAEAVASDLHTRFPDDLPATALLKRISKLRHDPPPADWDGVYIAKDK